MDQIEFWPFRRKKMVLASFFFHNFIPSKAFLLLPVFKNHKNNRSPNFFFFLLDKLFSKSLCKTALREHPNLHFSQLKFAVYTK